MVTIPLGEAQEAYSEARATAGVAHDSILGPEQARYEKELAVCRAAKTRLPRPVISRWIAAAISAAEQYEAIIRGPREDVDAALAAAGRNVSDDDH